MRSSLSLLTLVASLGFGAASESDVIDKTFIVKLSQNSDLSQFNARSLGHHDLFHKRAAESSLSYTVRHTYNSPGTYVGLSLEVHSDGTSDSIQAQLQAITGVTSVTPVYKVTAPDPNLSNSSITAAPSVTSDNGTEIQAAPTPGPDANLASALEMGGVDKLHALGIKGKGIKIGIVDTGVDYRNPALGGGFGPGFKIVGGYSFFNDNGTRVNSTDPLATCYSGGHGTHVAGIIGMDPLGTTEGYNITGVAPEADLYMYRVFDCTGVGGSDDMLAGMLKAQSDGVDVVSISANAGTESIANDDPLSEVTAKLHDAGIAVIVAAGNGESYVKSQSALYNTGQPSENPGVISVGAIANKDFPLVWKATDSNGSTIPYASLWPVELPEGADLFVIGGDGCDRSNWDQATTLISQIGNVSSTVFGFQVTDLCRPADATGCCTNSVVPAYIMGIYSDTSNPYLVDYDVPSTGYFATAHFTAVNANDSVNLLAGYSAAGGYGKYKLYFNESTFSSPAQFSGGLVDYYSNYGPTWLNYTMKPQISAPGGHTLSTWPLGPQGGYTILSGTSMATPYVSGCYALLKSQFPDLSVDEILDLLQTNSKPVDWAWDRTIISATVQQGAGMINAYDAFSSRTRVSPGQLLISDNSRVLYGAANITIENHSGTTRTYTLSHEGAGYTDEQLGHLEDTQLAMYGSATFSSPTVEVAAGASQNVNFTITPPDGVDPQKLPVFGGFIKVASDDNEEFTVPYAGPPYSLYNTDYILFVPSSPLPRVYYQFPNGSSIVDEEIIVVNSSIPYSSTIAHVQYTLSFRVDVVPANTDIKVNKYGFDTSIQYNYTISDIAPRSSIFGYPSYGYLQYETGLVPPSENVFPTGTGVNVTAADGTVYSPGTGDYRWLVSVLRWGGDETLLEDHDTWLGPIVRLVDGPV